MALVTVDAAGVPTSATGSATAPVVPFPASVPAGLLARMYVTVKLVAATMSAPSGWTEIATDTNGATAGVANTGSVRCYIFELDTLTLGTEGGTSVNISVPSGNSVCASIVTYESDTGTFVADVVAFGDKVGNSANMSATTTTQTDWLAGDLAVEVFFMNASLGTPSADTLTHTGVTFGTVTNQADRAVTTGNDCRLRINTVPVTSVTTPSGGSTGGYTNASSTSGILAVQRLRSGPPADVEADAESATGAATANQPTTRVNPNGESSAATGTAHQPTTTVKTSGGNAAATGTAQQPAASLRTNSATATATATALDATVSTAVATNATAQCATAAATANGPTVTIRTNAAPATGTGTANQPVTTVKTSAAAATATGVANQPTVQTGASASANAECATATATANGAAGKVGAAPATATATATAANTSASLRAAAVLASAAAIVNAAAAQLGAAPSTATASGTALAPTPSGRATAGVALALAPALDATVQTGGAQPDVQPADSTPVVTATVFSIPTQITRWATAADATQAVESEDAVEPVS